MNQHTTYCFISGFTEEIDRVFLRKELSKFGEIRKIFIPPTEEYAKVYFTDNSSAIKTLQSLKQNLFGWRVAIQQDTKSTNSESSSTSRMLCDDEFDVQNSSERLYTVHGQYIECLGDGMGNVYVNLEDVRRSGFAVYSEEDLNFSIEQKRGIILEDFYQYMLSQAMLYLNKKKELHKYIREEQIINTIERCRIKLLGDGRENNYNDRSVNQMNNNLKVSVPNRHEPQDKYLGRRQERDSNFGKNNSFGEDSPVVRPPKNLPNNYTPTHTQKYTGAGMQHRNRDSTSNRNNHETSRNNKPRFYQNRKSRSNTRNNDDEYKDSRRSESKQNHRPSTSKNDEECWSSEQPESKQQSQQTFKNSEFEKTRQPSAANNSNYNKNTESNQCDTLSQLSDSSEKKIKLMKLLESVDSIEKVGLEINQTYDVQIMEIEKNKICWVQKTESSQVLEDLHLAIMEDNSEFKAISDLQRGQLGLADFEDIWCRCRVMSLNPLNVLFVDYGNKAFVEDIKELPDKFRKIPALAIRLVVSQESQHQLSTGMSMKIKVKTKYDDDTYLVDIQKILDSEIPNKEEVSKQSPSSKIENTVSKSDSESSTPVDESKTETKEMCYVDIPKPLEELKNNDKVMLLDMINNRMIVKTRECVRKSKELLEYIKTLDKSNLVLTQVKEGQMVLGSKDGLPNLCRAVVTSKQSPTVTVRYLDYVGEDILLINSLRNVDEYLATQPTTLILTPEMEIINSITKKSIEFIASLIENKGKAVVILTEDNDFDLKLESGTLFTQKLLELEKSNTENQSKLAPVDDLTSTPKTKELGKLKDTEVAKSSPEPPVLVQEPAASSLEPESDVAIITFNDMDYFKPKIGATATYLCYTLKDLSEITLISMEEDSVEKLNSVSDLAINDDKPYKPEVHEMCVFLYKTPDETEPVWYRGVVMDKEKDEYTVSMVDFGTLVTITSKDIRKFPLHLKEIPMLGIFCELINIPHTEEVLNAVQKLVTEGDEVEVTVKWENDLTYGIELPKIYDELKKLKLL